MSTSINLLIKMNNNRDAMSAAGIITAIASKRVPESPNEIKKFLDGVVVKGHTVTVTDNYSLMSCTFRELIPQIMTELAKCQFGSISMNAFCQSFSCGYEAEFNGLIEKNGELKTSYIEVN